MHRWYWVFIINIKRKELQQRANCDVEMSQRGMCQNPVAMPPLPVQNFSGLNPRFTASPTRRKVTHMVSVFNLSRKCLVKYPRTPNRCTRDRQVIGLKFRQLYCGKPTEQCIKEIQYHINKLINLLAPELFF